MASYDYRCRDCGAVFEVRRAVTALATKPACPAGHTDVTRVWTPVATLTGAPSAPAAGGAGGGGSPCCGGSCGCR